MKYLLLALVATLAAADQWAVLVAGSNGYGNYRHQSDIYHAYQILTGHGIPESNIIVMHYDDIADNSQNPKKGQVFNSPGGPNNYVDIPKDYTGSETTADNFLKVLKGDSSAGGKVLGSTGDDTVFIYYSDHGAVGLVAMPVGGYLYANDLMDALTYMNENNMYSKLVFYLEACESGSMFENILPEDMNIYATTAANAHESSYAFYYDSEVGAYLGDEYSISWMEDSDDADFSSYTIGEQTDAVTARVALSHVMEYGDTKMRPELIAFYQGNQTDAKAAGFFAGGEHKTMTFADSRDVPLETLKMRLGHASSAEERVALKAELDAELIHRRKADQTFVSAATLLSSAATASPHSLLEGTVLPTDFDCLKASVEGVEESCGRFSDYSLKYVRSLVQMCEAGVPSSRIVSTVGKFCTEFQL